MALSKNALFSAKKPIYISLFWRNSLFLELAICPNYGIELEEWNHDIDHVHVMFKAQPTTELSKFINAYKSASSRLIKKEFPFQPSD